MWINLKDIKGKSWYCDFIQLIQTIFTGHLLCVRQCTCCWLLNHGTIYWAIIKLLSLGDNNRLVFCLLSFLCTCLQFIPRLQTKHWDSFTFSQIPWEYIYHLEASTLQSFHIQSGSLSFQIFHITVILVVILGKLKFPGRWEGGSGWETRVYPWWIHVDVWQNQYNIVK